MEKLNIAELLKDCPKGTKLWSDIHGECEYVGNSNSRHPLVLNAHTKQGVVTEITFTADGSWDVDYEGLCLLWPSKDHRTWDDWDEYEVSCLPKPERPKTYKEACEILGIPYDENAHPWVRLNILGEAWNKIDGVVDDNDLCYYPRFSNYGVICQAILLGFIGVPATFQDKKTAIKFGEAFKDFYLKL